MWVFKLINKTFECTCSPQWKWIYTAFSCLAYLNKTGQNKQQTSQWNASGPSHHNHNHNRGLSGDHCTTMHRSAPPPGHLHQTAPDRKTLNPCSPRRTKPIGNFWSKRQSRKNIDGHNKSFVGACIGGLAGMWNFRQDEVLPAQRRMTFSMASSPGWRKIFRSGVKCAQNSNSMSVFSTFFCSIVAHSPPVRLPYFLCSRVCLYFIIYYDHTTHEHPCTHTHTHNACMYRCSLVL